MTGWCLIYYNVAPALFSLTVFDVGKLRLIRRQMALANIYKNRIYRKIVLLSFSEACSFSCSGSYQFRPRPTFCSNYTQHNLKADIMLYLKKRSKFIDKRSKIYSLSVYCHTTMNSFHILPVKTNIFVTFILHSINIQHKQTGED